MSSKILKEDEMTLSYVEIQESMGQGMLVVLILKCTLLVYMNKFQSYIFIQQW